MTQVTFSQIHNRWIAYGQLLGYFQKLQGSYFIE